MIVMFDTVTVSTVPSFANTARDAVAGYVDGIYKNEAELEKAFPHAHHLSIAAHAQDDALCLDNEPGDATDAEVAAWVWRQMARGIYRPVVYTSLSNIMPMMHAIEQAGLTRADIRVWSAHYTMHPHVCSPALPSCQGFGLNFDADGTQWSDRALGRNLDESLVRDDFFDFAPPVVVVDPHYDWFDGTLRDFNGLEVSERGRMKHLDELLKMPVQHKDQIASCEAQIHKLFDRLWRVVHTGRHGETLAVGSPEAKKNWDKYRRGWRGKKLWEAASGKRHAP